MTTHATATATATATAAMFAAFEAFEEGKARPWRADWQGIATMLRAAFPAVQAKPEPAGAAPRWFADYSLPRSYHRDTLAVSFADGATVRVPLCTAPRKGPRIAAACRAAIGFYRNRTGREDVPAFAELHCLDTGERFDAAECSRLTVETRKPRPSLAPAPRDPGAVGRLELELDRRRAGLATALAAVPRKGTDKATRRQALERAAQWRAALRHGVAELVRLRSAIGAPAAAPAPAPAVALELAPTVAPELEPAPAPAAAPELAPELAPAAPLDVAPAVAPAGPLDGPESGRLDGEPMKSLAFSGPVAYGAPLQPVIPMAGHDSAPADTESAPPAPLDVQAGPAPAPAPAPYPVEAIAEPVEEIQSADPHPVEEIATAGPCPVVGISACPVVGMACLDDCAHRPGCEAATAAREPVEEIVAAGPAEPDATSHPIIAICLSHKGRGRLFERLQDGCFMAAEKHGATHGAFHVTLQDAREIGAIPGVRYVGMPRKAYTRRAA